jgi:Tfp pilus assembly protein PilV
MKSGFTLVEVMLVAGVFVLVIAGLLLMYISGLSLNDFNRNLTSALNISRTKIEELHNLKFQNITNHAYDSANLMATYNFMGSCSITVNNVTDNSFSPALTVVKDIRAVVSWRQLGGRVIGEDKNFNGVWDTGEDTMIENGQLDSPCTIETAIAEK